jgi:hypothetical protein
MAYPSVGKTRRKETKGQIVAVCSGFSDERGLSLIPQISRVLCKNQIHEMMTTDEAGAAPNKTVDRIGVACFFEITQGSSVAVGDPVFINNKEVGKIAGFDETHFPNHYNIVVISTRRFTGNEAGYKIDDPVSIGTAQE